jgi:hypothetical protein
MTAELPLTALRAALVPHPLRPIITPALAPETVASTTTQEFTMTATLLSQTGKITRTELQYVPVPPATPTHQPLSHHEIVRALLETLNFRRIEVVRDEYAVSQDGMRMFGVLDLEYGITGVRFSIGIRNANDKSMRLAMCIGYRVLVCDNMAFHGDFTPVLAKHSKHFSLADAVSIGVDRMQRNFEPLAHHIESAQQVMITDDQAKLTIYRAFVEGELQIPRHLARAVHTNYFEPSAEEFQPRTVWSLSNAFTSAFKELDAIPQFRATAKLAGFLGQVTR